ncbi:glycosyltransferase [Kocuria sp. U4B]
MTDALAITQAPVASVVICFKDWGLDRLELSIRSLLNAFGQIPFEIVVSDYGSVELDRHESRRRIEALGARYIYTDTNGVWSRSRALNAGFAVCRGDVLICTDADMLFTPGALAPVVQSLQEADRDVIVLQCRDLPPTHTHETIDFAAINWRELERVSRFRPRWGMGGMIAFSRDAYLEVRGLDERLEIYGGEDLDFAKRMKRTGRAVRWWDSPECRMYHIWHEPTRDLMANTDAGQRAMTFNRNIHSKDMTTQRNLRSWQHPVVDRAPLFSVVISTHNRADYLSEALSSVLCQTVDDFELIVVDDGSTDHTAEVVASFGDDRIRYFPREQAGLAAARNHAMDVSRGRFTVVHDDDDIMLPWRLDSHLSRLEPGSVGSYGGWIDFDDETGEMSVLQGKELTQGSLLFTGAVYLHPTLMVRTDVLRALRYTDTFRSGSDYSLGMKLMRSGFRLNHTGEIHTLRRLHPGQITESQGVTQKASAVLTGYMAKVPMTSGNIKTARQAARELRRTWVPGTENVFGHYGAYLPDRLVERAIKLDNWIPDNVLAQALHRNRASEFFSYRVRDVDGVVHKQGTVVEGCSWDDMRRLRAFGPLSVSEHRSRSRSTGGEELDAAVAAEGAAPRQLVRPVIEQVLLSEGKAPVVAPITLDRAALTELAVDGEQVQIVDITRSGQTARTYSVLTGEAHPLELLGKGLELGALPMDSNIKVASPKAGAQMIRQFAQRGQEGRK